VAFYTYMSPPVATPWLQVDVVWLICYAVVGLLFCRRCSLLCVPSYRKRHRFCCTRKWQDDKIVA